MAEGAHYEIERKYLIRRPGEALLEAPPGCEVWQIEQIYLRDEPPWDTRRVRRVRTGGEERYYRTFKSRVTTLSAREDENRLDRAGYEALVKEAREGARPILKTRYRIPWEGHVLEFDLYPFWEDRAILEIELEREDEAVRLPDYVRLIREVTGDARYKNFALAHSVPMDAID